MFSCFVIGAHTFSTYRVLADMLAPHRKSKAAKLQTQPRTSTETPAENDSEAAPITVLPSSTDLFYFYGQSLDQCAKLSTGQALFDLCNVHKKWLRIYAGTCTDKPLVLCLLSWFGFRGRPCCGKEVI